MLSATNDYHRIGRSDLAATVTIGHPVWVGAGAVILPGVSIGAGAVVASGSVVTTDAAPFTIVAGNPARFIKNRDIANDCAIYGCNRSCHSRHCRYLERMSK